MVRRYLGKTIFRIRMILSKLFDSIKMMLILAHIRNDAHGLRREVVKKKGRKVINKQVKNAIKAYSKRRFGRKSYWPYLALYTEVRGEFIEGWIPYDYFRFVFAPKLNPKPAVYLSAMKTFDFQLFGDFAVKPLFVYISDSYFDADLKYIHPDQVVAHFSEYNDTIVIKEGAGWGGLQVRIIHASEFTPDLLKEGSSYIIQPYVKQYKVLHDLYPDSVNTFRVNTFLKKDGSVSIKYVCLRFGADGSRVDNLTSGGSHLFFNLSGKPDKLSYDYNLGTEFGDRHKNTGYRYSDIKIPMFNEMLEKCKNAHLKFPYVRLIAWDVCIDSTGDPKLIEWNAINPAFYGQEAQWGPFWADDSEI